MREETAKVLRAGSTVKERWEIADIIRAWHIRTISDLIINYNKLENARAPASVVECSSGLAHSRPKRLASCEERTLIRVNRSLDELSRTDSARFGVKLV